jgi:hypothetical protein
VNEGAQYLQTSIYVTAHDRAMMEALQEQTGLNRSALVRLAINRMYEGERGDSRVRLLEIAEELRTLA